MQGCTLLVLVLSLTPRQLIRLGAGLEMEWWEGKHTYVGPSTRGEEYSVLKPGLGQTPTHRQAETPPPGKGGS